MSKQPPIGASKSNILGVQEIPGKSILKGREVIRKYIDHLEVDRPLYNDHNKMMKLVKSGEILDEVEKVVGKLG